MPDTINIAEIMTDYFPREVLKRGDSFHDDFTFYVKNNGDLSFLVEKDELEKINKNHSIAKQIRIKLCGEVKEARALICKAYRGKLLSISVRLKDPPKITNLPAKVSGVWETTFSPNEKRGSFLNSLKEICELLEREIFLDREDPQGLIVIAGSTASAKSQISRGIIDLRLKYLRRNIDKRRPHLITYEDPIESFFGSRAESTETFFSSLLTSDSGIVKIPAQDLCIDYTPREKNTDVINLTQALRDAKRQTPKIFFIGETRREQDWKNLISFAGSGHLVITTAHAGSLIETMQMIFRATQTKTPSTRNLTATRILGIVHLKRCRNGGKNVLLPSVWRRTSKGKNDLTATGMASVVPGSDYQDDVKTSSLGRKYFAEKLFAAAVKSKSLDNLEKEQLSELKKSVISDAIKFDLNGE